MKSIDFVAASFRRELEEDEFWLNSQDDSEGEISSGSLSSINEPRPKSVVINAAPKVAKKEEESTEALMLVKANYDFTAELENELSLKKGDIIKVTKRIDEGWWVGSCNGKSGMFPSNYVSVVDEKKQTAEKEEELDLDNFNPSIESSESNDDSKSAQSVAKPGFSYLPQGAPITFIGRKALNSKSGEAAPKVEIVASCSQCDCDEFAANVFKPGHCNNCFHKH